MTVMFSFAFCPGFLKAVSRLRADLSLEAPAAKPEDLYTESRISQPIHHILFAGRDRIIVGGGNANDLTH